jgi:hypothetical protein
VFPWQLCFLAASRLSTMFLARVIVAVAAGRAIASTDVFSKWNGRTFSEHN